MGNLDRPDGQSHQDMDEKTSRPTQKCGGVGQIPRTGDRCPSCQQGVLDYDGMLNLSCPKCGAVVNTGGAFT